MARNMFLRCGREHDQIDVVTVFCVLDIYLPYDPLLTSGINTFGILKLTHMQLLECRI
jgi:hypothetical protein